ncbi:MAG: nucleotide sugar dehydrogenase [Candidatus Methylomirabilia bacterium]
MSAPLSTLRDRLDKQTAVVGVIGLGYVGLPQALAFGEAGFPVLGFDIDQAKGEAIARGESYLNHIPSVRIARLVERGKLGATDDFSRLGECDVIVICVPTPLTAQREPDLSAITGTVQSLVPRLRAGQLVVLVSTTYPGTAEELVRPALEATGLVVGRDVALGYAPEREDPGSSAFGLQNTPKLVAGCTEVCRDLTERLYRQVVEKVIPVSTPRVAEAAKLLENIYRAVNIALVNELKLCFDRMGLDVWEVIEAAATKPFGFTPFTPGPGLGGHCLPIDPFYLTWKAREYDVHTRFIELAGEINTAMPEYVVGRIREALSRQGVALKGARLLILGVAYKRDIGDTRESPALRILWLLRQEGAEVRYHDPFVPRLGRFRKYEFDLESTPLSAEVLQDCHAVVIITDHSSIDYGFVVRHARLVVDTRNATRGVAVGRERILKA